MIKRSSTPDVLQTSLSIYQFKSAVSRKSVPLAFTSFRRPCNSRPRIFPILLDILFKGIRNCVCSLVLTSDARYIFRYFDDFNCDHHTTSQHHTKSKARKRLVTNHERGKERSNYSIKSRSFVSIS